MSAEKEHQQDRINRLQGKLKRVTAGVLVAAALAEMVGVAFIKLDKKPPRR